MPPNWKWLKWHILCYVYLSTIKKKKQIRSLGSFIFHSLRPGISHTSPGRAPEGTGEGRGQGGLVVAAQLCLWSRWGCFTDSASLWDSASMPGSQVSLPPRDPKCFSVCSFHLSFDWVEASSLPGINIHNKQQAINLTSWNLLCTRLNSKPASAGCLFFIIDALHMTAPKHLNLKHTVVQNSCCPPSSCPTPWNPQNSEFHRVSENPWLLASGKSGSPGTV